MEEGSRIPFFWQLYLSGPAHPQPKYLQYPKHRKGPKCPKPKSQGPNPVPLVPFVNAEDGIQILPGSCERSEAKELLEV